MALRYYYANTATTVLDITARCRLYRTSVKSNAEEGSVALSTLIIDDPDGDLEIIPFRRIYITETTAPAGRQVVYNGYVTDRTVRRGPFEVGAGREWVVQLADPNWFIGLRIVVGSDAVRPVEDDYTRVRWLLTTTEANTFNGSTQYVNPTVERFPMDAVDYRGQSVTSILDDCAQASGKNWWVIYLESIGQYALWYDFAESEVYDSALYLSNALSDIDNTVVFPISEENTSLERSPSRLVSGVYLPYDGGWVYRLNTPVGAQYVYRDMAAPSENVKTQAAAIRRADRYLADNDSEDDVIRTEVLLPAAQVNDIMHGHRVHLRATHLPGYELSTWMRVLNRTVTETSEQFLTVGLELSPLPPLPEQFPAYAELWAASYGPAGSGPVYFIYDGDDPPSGTAGTPLTGSLSYYDVGTGHTPQYHGAAHRGGINVLGDGTLTMRYTGDFITVGWSNRNYTASIRVNGVTVASDTVNITEGIGEWDVLATDIPVVNGDRIEVYEASLPGTVFLTPSGTGGGRFWVSGNLT